MSELEQVAREFYRRIELDDVAGVIELLSDDITWTIPGPPVIPYAGTFYGKAGVIEFFRILEAHEDLRSFVPEEFIVDEKRRVVCVIGSETGASLATRRSFQARWAEVFSMRDGLIVAFEEHIDTFALAEAYSPSGAAGCASASEGA